MTDITTFRTPEEALDLLLQRITSVGFETVPLLQALGRINYADIHADIDYPPFNRSPLDGYAVRAEDISSANSQHAVVLHVTQTLFAGDTPSCALKMGEAAQVTTGAQLPPQTSCVVKQEDAKRENEFVSIFANPGQGKNLIFRGEDIQRGDLLVSQGETLDSAHIGLLASQGLAEVRVFAQARVGLMSTGNELLASGTELLPGKIYDSNYPMLAARVRLLGGLTVAHPREEDDAQLLCDAITALLKETDMVITTGGVSVGEKDLMLQAGTLLGAEIFFRKLDYKPGGHVVVMQKDGKLIFCLSGNPFAACASFEFLTAPCLRKLLGACDYRLQRHKGVMQNDYTKKSPTRRFVRARIINGQVFIPTGNHSSSGLATLPGCNCLLDIPAGTAALYTGDDVNVIMFQGGCVL